MQTGFVVITSAERPSPGGNTEFSRDLQGKLERRSPGPGDKLVGVRLTDSYALEIGSLQGQSGGHGPERMHNAYPMAREKVCSLRDDLCDAGMQNAYMQGPKNHLPAWRRFRHLTQEELADRVGTTKAVISNLETGARGLSDKWLRRLAPALDTSPGYIMDHDPNDLPTAVLDIWADIPTESRDQALRVLESFRKAG